MSKKIKFLDNTKVWKCFGPVLVELAHVNHGEGFAIVEVIFLAVGEAHQNLDKTLKTEEAGLLPPYVGRRTSKIKIEVPLEADVA